MHNKKLISTTILEVIFTIALIFLLVLIRQQVLNNIQEIQSYSAEISYISEDIQNPNLTAEQTLQIDTTLDEFDRILNKSLILLQVVLPVSIFILSFVFYYLIWYTLTRISLKRFLMYSSIPLILLLITVFFALNYIAYYYFFIDENPLPQLIISALLLITTYYLALFNLSNKKPFKHNLKLALKNVHKFILPYLLILITNIAYIVLVFYLFFLTFVKAPIIIPSILLLLTIIIINLQRMHFIKKTLN